MIAPNDGKVSQNTQIKPIDEHNKTSFLKFLHVVEQHIDAKQVAF